MAEKQIPGPDGLFILGNMRDFRADPPTFLLNLALEYGEITHFRILHYPLILLADSDLIRDVLVTNSAHFQKSPLDKKILSKFLGNGLLTSEGDFHQRQRRLAQPAFHHHRIKTYAEVMVDYALHVSAAWVSGETRDIAADMMRLTMYIVAKTLFDADGLATSGETAETVGHAIHDLQKVSNTDFRRGFVVPDWIPTPNNRRRKQAVTIYGTTIEQIIALRRASDGGGQITDTGDLLSMLMLARDEDGSAMTDHQLQDEVATLFAAGHETTSNALSWTWYLLAQHPAIEAKLHQELDTVLHGRPPTMEDLKELPYTLMIIKEALRLYPPAWILNGRVPLTDIEIGGYPVPKDTDIMISPYVMHRLPHHFPEPEKFKPERWTPGAEKALPRFAYMPFGGGPHICIGNSFAMMEAHLILATIAQQYRLQLVPGTEVILNPQITLSPANGLPMIVSERLPDPERRSQPALIQTSPG